MRHQELKDKIETLSVRRRYAPLSKKLKSLMYPLYENHLNGFDKPRELTIDDTIIANGFERVVIGDYGAYVEISPEQLLVDLPLEPGQEWRTDVDFINQRGLNIKYRWHHFNGRKVYYQLATVKYADYKAGYYYISVLDFDEIQ